MTESGTDSGNNEIESVYNEEEQIHEAKTERKNEILANKDGNEKVTPGPTGLIFVTPLDLTEENIEAESSTKVSSSIEQEIVTKSET